MEAPLPAAPEGHAPIQRLLALAYVIEDRVRSGTLPNYAAAARWLGVTSARISQIVSLTLLAPEIQGWILCALPREIASLRERHVRPIAAMEAWELQMQVWGNLVLKGCASEGVLAASVSTA